MTEDSGDRTHWKLGLAVFWSLSAVGVFLIYGLDGLFSDAAQAVLFSVGLVFSVKQIWKWYSGR